MPTNLEKEWAAVDGDEIVMKRNTRKELLDALFSHGLDPDDYEIIALPKTHGSIWI